MTNGERRKPFRHDRQRKGSQCIVGKKHRRTRNAGRKLMTTQIVILIVFTIRTYKSDEDMTVSSTLPFLCDVTPISLQFSLQTSCFQCLSIILGGSKHHA